MTTKDSSVKKSRVPRYKVGDIVKVRDADHISKTLDSFFKCDGCLFTEQMWKYCEKDFRIIKVVKHFFDEHKQKMFRSRFPLYILEGLICDGKVEAFEQRCDHSCFLLWHEAWVECT
jgi:hypothetical protein